MSAARGMSDIRLRTATDADTTDIAAVVTAAFDRPDEADLVSRLRADGDVVLSLLAEDADGRIVGHALFGRLELATGIVADDGPVRAVFLAPVSVLPDRQHAGIGSMLIRFGLSRMRSSGREAVFVLGDPAYYARFGFDAERAAGFDCQWSGPHLMALELVAGVLGDGTGTLRYPAAFGGSR